MAAPVAELTALLRQRDLAYIVLASDVTHRRVIVLRYLNALLSALVAPFLHKRLIARLAGRERIGVLVLDDQRQVEAAALGEVTAVDVVVLDPAKLLGDLDRCDPGPLQALEISVSHGRMDLDRSERPHGIADGLILPGLEISMGSRGPECRCQDEQHDLETHCTSPRV